MEQNIHIGTLITIIVMGHALAGLLGGLYLAKRKKDVTLYTFLTARFFDSFAWTLIGLKDFIPSYLSIYAGNAFLVAGTAMQIASFLSVKDLLTTQVKRLWYSTVFFFLLFFQFILSIYSSQETLRIAMVSLCIAIFWSIPIYFSLKDKNATPLQKLITLVYGVEVILLIYRAISAIAINTSEMLMENSKFNIIFYLWLYVVALVGNIGLILLSKEKSDQILTKAASCDELTNLYNRRAFFLHARECVSLCARQNTPVSFLIMDLDHFKKINDFYGHIMGDMVIKNFAATVKQQLREYDVLGRIGGEEFTAILPGVCEKESYNIAQRLRSSVEQNIVNNAVKYTVSIGVTSLIPDKNTTIEQLYELGDSALYKAKHGGRNQIGVVKVES